MSESIANERVPEPDPMAKQLWHIERKINELNEKVVTIQQLIGAIVAHLNEMIPMPGVDDDDWLPPPIDHSGVGA